MAIKDWVTIYPVGLDTVTQMPDLVLFVDKTRSSQMMAARNAIWTLETRVGSNALEAGSLYKRVADLEGSSGTDEKVKNTASDSTAGYLNDKIAAANGLAKATLNPGGNEQLQLSPSYGSTVNTVCQGNDSRLGDARTPVAHDLSGVLHNSTTLANLNLKISDANLDDASSPRTDPNAFHKTTAAEISALATEKVTPVAGDWLVGEDSAAGNAKVKIQVGNLPGGSGTDPDAFHKTTAAEISALATEKALPVAGDWLVGEDSAAGNAKVKIQVGSLPKGDTVPLSAAGDLLTHSGVSLARVPRPTEDNLMLLSDSTMPLKMRWGTLPAHSETHEAVTYPYTSLIRYYGPISPVEPKLGEAALRIYGNSAVMFSRYYIHIVVYDEIAKEWPLGFTHILIPSVNGYNADGDIYENTIVAGRTNGRFFVFRYTEGLGWNEEQIVLSDPYSANFGYSIAINEWGCIVSDIGKNTDYASQGAVYVYKRDPTLFGLKQTILPDAPDLNFGLKIKLDGTQLAITARSSTSEIVLYIYELSGTTWVKKTRIQFPGTVFAATLCGLALKGTQCLVATPKSGTNSITSLTRRDGTWIIDSEFFNPDAGNAFGNDIALVESRCLIGKNNAYNNKEPPEVRGGVYYYKFDGTEWVFIYKFTLPDSKVGLGSVNVSPAYGWSVAFNGSTALLGGAYADFASHEDLGLVDIVVFSGDPLDSLMSADEHAFHDNVKAEIFALTEKEIPVADDVVVGEDSANLYSKIKIKVSNLPGGSGTDPDAFHKTTAGEIAAVEAKATPTTSDLLLIEDVADANKKKSIVIGNLPFGSGTDPDAIHGNVAGEIAALATEKTTPVANDWLIGEDSASSNAKVKIKVGSLPTGAAIPLTTAGDILTHSGSSLVRVPIPPLNDLVLVSDTAQPYKMKWAQVPGHAAAHTGDLVEPWIRELRDVGIIANAPLGSSVVVSGNTLAAAAADFGTVTQYVKIWVKEAGSWKLQQTLDYNTDRTLTVISGYTGSNLALDKDTLLVGKSKYASNRGNVDVWKRNPATGEWGLETTLVAPDALSDRRFGVSVAIHDNTCAIGAHYDDTVASNAGAVYVFTRSGTSWSFQQKLTPAELTSNGYLGATVDVEKDTLVAAAYGDHGVYFWKRTGTTWTRTELFLGNYNVSLSGNWAVTGASGGYCKIYKRVDEASAWTLHTTLAAPEALMYGETNVFGTSLAIDGSTLIVGAWNRYEIILPSGPLINCGVAYSFKLEHNVWVLRQKFKPLPADISPQPYDRDPYKYEFGRCVAVDGNLIAIAEEFGGPVDRGAFYVYNYYADIITVLEAAELERTTTGLEPLGSTVSFDLTGAAPSGLGKANTPSGYRIMVFRNGIKMTYAATPATYMDYYYDAGNNEIDVLAPGSADVYHIVFF